MLTPTWSELSDARRPSGRRGIGAGRRESAEWLDTWKDLERCRT